MMKHSRGMKTNNRFTCNVCGASNQLPDGPLERETPSCERCGSNVRIRSLIRALALELFGASLRLDEFPRLKGVRGLGLSDSDCYAGQLADRFDYINTFFHQEPRLDISDFTHGHLGEFDFVLSSEVFEHVKPPAEKALGNLHSVLKPDGKLIFTTPYAPGGETAEHFSGLAAYGLASLAGEPVLVARTHAGDLIASDDLVFHGGEGWTLEARRFSAEGLRQTLHAAGFDDVAFHADDDASYGILHSETWSLPMCARKGGSKPIAPAAEMAREFASVLGRCRAAETLVEERTRWAGQAAAEGEARLDWGRRLEAKAAELEAELRTRTEWGQSLDRQFKEECARTQQLEGEIAKRTQWALGLDEEIATRNGTVLELRTELTERTQWAQTLEQQLDESNRQSAQLREELAEARLQIAALSRRPLQRLRSFLRG